MRLGKRSQRGTQQNLARRSPVSSEQRSGVFSYYAGSSRTRAERPQQNRLTMTPQTTRSAPLDDSKKRSDSVVGKVSHKMQARHIPSYAALLAVLIGILWALSLSGSPRVVVERVSGISPERDALQYTQGVSDIWSGSWRNFSKLTTDTDHTEQEILSKYTELSQVRIQLPLLGRRPTIVLVPTAAAFRIESGGKTYYVSPDGRALLDTSVVDTGSSLLTVNDETSVEVSSGKQILSHEAAQFLVQLDAQLRAERVNSPVLTLSNQAANQVTMKTPDHDYYVKFQIDDPATVRQAVGSYMTVRNHFASSGSRPGEYVDVRIPDKVFYR